MKRSILTIFILILFCSSTVTVNAMEYIPEETVTESETVITENEENLIDEPIVEDILPDDGNEEQSVEIIEKLNDINNNLTMILYTSMFMIFVHFSEKWLKILMSIPRKWGN